MATNIYILKLQNNKYYVGKTNNIKKRILEHESGSGCLWTSIYKPIKIINVFANVSSFDEDKYVKEYMQLYGIDNVRGGSYVSQDLNPIQIYSLQKELWAATDCCTRCGYSGHFIKSCYAKIDVNGNTIIDFDFQSTKTQKQSKDESDYCVRCGRNGHLIKACYATVDINGNNIIDIDLQTTNTKNPKCCSRCGRTSHTISNCYAKTHV